MLAVERRERIHDIIKEEKSVIVSDLAKQFKVTDETIRRDLALMEKQNILTRTYGGAFIQEGVINDIGADLRENVMVKNKNDIAGKAVKLINNGDSIFIDCSTTALALARQLKNKRIVVTTTSMLVANVLSETPNITLYVTGGKLNERTMSFLGASAATHLAGFYFDKCFISCRSLSIKHGVTDSNEELAKIRAMAVHQSQHVCLLADHSKFDRTSFSKICDFGELHSVVSDEGLAENWQTLFALNDVQLY